MIYLAIRKISLITESKTLFYNEIINILKI